MDEPLEWVERLGGWAVVILIVRWMMSRIDAQLKQNAAAIDAFKAFETEERRAHDSLIGTTDQAVELLHDEIKVHEDMKAILREIRDNAKGVA